VAVEYRIDYTILRRQPGEADFTDVGFGTSNSWSSIDQAMHIVHSDVQNRLWETEDGMPDPSELEV
jgi:hypothetical protein